MSTINQITKQIATANKRVANFEKKIEMYTERTIKAIAMVNKANGLNITINDVREEVISKHNGYILRDVILDKKFKDCISWVEASKIENNYESIKENERNKAFELRNIARLEDELAAIKQAQDAKEKAYNSILENALREAMKGFEQAWFERMIEWFGSHFDYVKDITPCIKAKFNRIRMILNALSYNHRQIRHSLEEAKKRFVKVISDDANRFESKDEYLKHCKEELHKEWESGVIKLTEKCQSFGIDEAHLSVDLPKLTSKGFEVYISDNKQRMIHARVIWAAEYSTLVQPHTRYIVTETRNK